MQEPDFFDFNEAASRGQRIRTNVPETAHFAHRFASICFIKTLPGL